ncbi:hypothetical protein E0Z10_g10719, partial [Xylaria hypoxylon]
MSTAPSDLPKNEAKAPALTCLEKVLDLSSYGAWNTFVPSASLTAPGHAETLAPELAALASRPG